MEVDDRPLLRWLLYPLLLQRLSPDALSATHIK
jgi:hypothetical protein